MEDIKKQKNIEVLAKYKDTKYFKTIERILRFCVKYSKIISSYHAHYLRTILIISTRVIKNYDADKLIKYKINIDTDLDLYLKIIKPEADRIMEYYTK